MSKIKKNELEGDATFKQSWKLAHNFAYQCENMFPQYEHKSLARLFNGAIFYHHEKTGKKLSKKEASEMISNESNVPECYIQELQEFLSDKNNDKPTNIDGIEALPRE
tara:strand:+ start:345 stop:668 length:324 start_codon:yes stop_codon:yes gene_type:complete